MDSFNILAIAVELFGYQGSEQRERYAVLCPFHNDRHPSLLLKYDGSWRCYPCGKRGSDMFSLIAELRGIDKLEACDVLYPYWDDNTTGVLDFHPQSTQVADAKYASNLAMVQMIVAGNAPHIGMKDDWSRPTSDAMYYMFNRGFYAETLQNAHVVVWEAMDTYPLMFPLCYNGQVLGFQVRAIHPYITPKYLTMPGLSKSLNIYGTAQQGEPLLICEGITDYLMATQYGFPNCIFTLGAYPSDVQLLTIRDLDPAYILSGYDLDTAGRSGYHLLSKGIGDIPIVQLNLKRDIASCGRNRFLNAVSDAKEKLSTKQAVLCG